MPVFSYGNVCICSVVCRCSEFCLLRSDSTIFAFHFCDHLNSNIGLYFVITKVLSNLHKLLSNLFCYVRTSLYKEIQARIEEPRKFIQVILEPRQVGKTTMVNQLLQKLSLPYVYESADAVSATNSAWLTQVWETARFRMKAANVSEYLLVED